MAQPTPEQQAAALLKMRESALARFEEDVNASKQLHADRIARAERDRDAELAHIGSLALDILQREHKLDERAPEAQAAPEKPKRLTLLSRGDVNRLLDMLPPDLAHAVKQHTTPELAQLLISAKARRLADHVALIEQEIGGGREQH